MTRCKIAILVEFLKQSLFVTGIRKRLDGYTVKGSRLIFQWELNDDQATLFHSEPQSVVLTDPANDSVTLKQLVPICASERPEYKGWRLLRSPHSAGEYYPRIHRPVYYLTSSPGKKIGPLFGIEMSHSMIPHDVASVSETKVQLQILVSKLDEIFRYIKPVKANEEVFGHEIRSLLILACTEFEAQCKGVLRANGVKEKRTNTNDYVVLEEVMKLRGYKVRLVRHSDIGDRQPFQHWSKNSPKGTTKSLPWYNAYNLTKHNRESEFHKAKLVHVLDAIAACFVMFWAQYGPTNNTLSITGKWGGDVGLVQSPRWSRSLCYSTSKSALRSWAPKFYQFRQ